LDIVYSTLLFDVDDGAPPGKRRIEIDDRLPITVPFVASRAAGEKPE
jgi:hypothetical protein